MPTPRLTKGRLALPRARRRRLRKPSPYRPQRALKTTRGWSTRPRPVRYVAAEGRATRDLLRASPCEALLRARAVSACKLPPAFSQAIPVLFPSSAGVSRRHGRWRGRLPPPAERSPEAEER